MITVVGSLKGGSGKSTVTFNLAVWLTMAELSVKLIDADPQATLSDVVDVRREEGFEPSIKVAGVAALNKSLKGFDEVLVDIGTADMDAMRKALSIADRVVVPVPPSQADIWSTQRFMTLVREVKRDTEIAMLAFINRGDTHHAVRETTEAAAALVSLPGIKFVKPRLSQRTVYRRSFSEGLAVFELEPNGKAAREFYAVAGELYKHVIE